MSTNDAGTACPGAVATRVFHQALVGGQRRWLDRACAAYGAAAIHAVVRIDTVQTACVANGLPNARGVYKQGARLRDKGKLLR